MGSPDKRGGMPGSMDAVRAMLAKRNNNARAEQTSAMHAEGDMPRSSKRFRLGKVFTRLMVGREDPVDRSVDPPLTEGPDGYRAWPPDHEQRAALDAIRPDFYARMAQELRNPTPAQVLSADQEAEILKGFER